jgi:hypothetical protein
LDMPKRSWRHELYVSMQKVAPTADDSRLLRLIFGLTTRTHEQSKHSAQQQHQAREREGETNSVYD